MDGAEKVGRAGWRVPLLKMPAAYLAAAGLLHLVDRPAAWRVVRPVEASDTARVRLHGNRVILGGVSPCPIRTRAEMVIRGVDGAGPGRLSAEELEAAVIRHGGVMAAAAALGMTRSSLTRALDRVFGIPRERAAASRGKLRRLIEEFGVEAVAGGLGGAPPEAVRRWAANGAFPGSVMRAVAALSGDDGPEQPTHAA